MIVVYKNGKRYKEYKGKYLKNIKEQYAICRELGLPNLGLYELKLRGFILQGY